MTKKLVSIGLVSVTLLILIYTHPIWTRYPGGRWIFLIGLAIVAGFLWLIIKLIREIIGLVKNRKTFKSNHLVPVILIAGVFSFIFFTKSSFDIEDKIYGKVLFSACHEGSLNTQHLNSEKETDLKFAGQVCYLLTIFSGHINKLATRCFLSIIPTDQHDLVIVFSWITKRNC